MKREMPVDRRNILIVVCLTLAAVVMGGVAFVMSGSDGRSGPTGGTGTTASAETTEKYVFMTEGTGTFAKLDMVVGPTGQITGTHVIVRFSDDTGQPVPGKPESFGGTYTDGRFELTGLSDNRAAYNGTLQGDTLTLDGTFGVSNEVWSQIPSVAAFDAAVQKHADSLEGCEQEGYLGCKES